MRSILTWVRENPGLMSAVTWPFVLALLTILLKPRTPAQYSALVARRPVWFFARYAAFTQLLGVLGIDAVKLTGVASKVVMGTVWVPPPTEHGKAAAPIPTIVVSEDDEEEVTK